MSLLAWFDHRTLFACQFLLATVFAAVFLVMQRVYPTVRGLLSAAIAFLLGIFGSLAFFLRGSIPAFVSIVLGNLMVLAAVIFVYDATVRFTGGRRLTNYLWFLMLPAAAVLWYYSNVRLNIMPRIVVMALLSSCVMAFAAAAILTRTHSFSSRLTMRILGASFLFKIVTEIGRAVMTVSYGAPQNYMTSDPVQTLTLAFNIFYICAASLCFLFMVNHELIARTREESEQDLLSGALNRRGIESRLAIELRRIARGGQRLSIALIDIDYFKSINDDYGHAIGDAAIQKVARTISNKLRAYDALGRFGGDEFLLLLPNTHSSDTFTIANRLGRAVNALSIYDLPYTITLSIGITEATPEDDATSLLVRADKALYQAKRDGRNCHRTLLPGAISSLEALPLDTAMTSASRSVLLPQ